MAGTTIMMVPEGFKIRKKSDVEVFMNKCMLNGNEYYIITDAIEQYIFRKYKNGDISVSWRNGDLSDIFNPSLEVARTNNNCYQGTVEEYIWQNRKYINAKWFGRKKYV